MGAVFEHSGRWWQFLCLGILQEGRVFSKKRSVISDASQGRGKGSESRGASSELAVGGLLR